MIKEAHNNLIKLCVIIKSLNTSVDLLMNVDSAIAQNITENFAHQCSILMLSLDSGSFLIDLLTWNAAEKLHSYLMIQKLTILGFSIRHNDFDFLDTIEALLNNLIE